jgi:uncharacterized protein YjbI with pentapeptide repeats
MADTADVEWETCGDGCIGIRPEGAKGCLAHDPQHRDAALQRLGEDGHIDACGVTIDAKLFGQVLTAASQVKDRPVLLDARFKRATFQEGAGFDGATFKGPARFDRARFEGPARFYKATFEGPARFDGATFTDYAAFVLAPFNSGAVFDGAAFEGDAGFDGATFEGDAWFDGATFEGDASFDTATFEGEEYEAKFHKARFKRLAWFVETTFEGQATFSEATFAGLTSFDGVTFKDDAWFVEATFEQSRQLGPMLVPRLLALDDATFKQPVRIQTSTQALSCQRARFLAGVHFRLRWAKVTLEDADLAAPAILTGAPGFEGYDEGDLLASWPDLASGPPRPPGQPWVASLCRADVAGLAIANADLQACRFAGAHHLDRLRLESPKAFTAAPGVKAVVTGWAWPPLWWWTRRQTLAEEHAWRAAHERGIRQAGWHADEAWPATASRWVPNPPRPTRDLGRLERHVARAARDWRRLHRLRRRLALTRRIGLALARQELAHRRQAIRTRQRQASEVANLYRALRKAHEDAKDEPGAADFFWLFPCFRGS